MSKKLNIVLMANDKVGLEITEYILKQKEQVVASSLDGSELNIAVKVGDEEQLFESINSQKIVEKLKEIGFEVKKSQIKLENPIKELGEFPVSIILGHNLEAEIKVIITAEKNKEKEEE